MQESKLDFAYKYPFSQEAKEVVADLHATAINQQQLREGVSRLKGALKEGNVAHANVKGLSEVKYSYIMGYVYARMLVSALGDAYAIRQFAAAEAKTAADILSRDTTDNLVKVANELQLGVRKENGDFAIDFEKFVLVPSVDNELKLVNQRLRNGVVYVEQPRLLKLVGRAIEKEISSKLPIDKRELPREVMEAARGIRPQEQKIMAAGGKGTYGWIEKLLQTPIPDVRHRTVNLVLAPYLVNVKNMDVEEAAKIINEYI
jgi:DNA primase large subunit